MKDGGALILGVCTRPVVKLCADDTELKACTNLPTQLTRYVLGKIQSRIFHHD
jgi:hypothetical protein